MTRDPVPTDPERELGLGRIALWLDPDDLIWLASRENWCTCTDETPPDERERCGRIRFRANAAAHKSGLEIPPSARLIDELRPVVMAVWDPIGIADQEAAADEYDSYLPAIWHELGEGSPESLAALLHDISTRRMGLSRQVSEDMASAQALFAWSTTPTDD